MNDKAIFAIDILKKYSDEYHVFPRSTSDLSPLEEWLIIQLWKEKKQN